MMIILIFSLFVNAILSILLLAKHNNNKKTTQMTDRLIDLLNFLAKEPYGIWERENDTYSTTIHGIKFTINQNRLDIDQQTKAGLHFAHTKIYDLWFKFQDWAAKESDRKKDAELDLILSKIGVYDR